MDRSAERPDDNRAIAIALMIGATMIFACADLASKTLLTTLEPVVASWLRAFIVMLVTVPFAILRAGPRVLATGHPAAQLTRGLTVCMSSLAFLFGLSQLSIAEAVAINFMHPMLTTALSVLILSEKIGIRRWSAAFVGFIGVLIIIQPGTSAFQTAAFYPMIAATLWSFASISTRRMMVTERPETTLAWSAIIACAVMSLLVPFFWRMPTWREIGLGLLVGLGSAIGHALVVFAFERARASLLAPFSYIQLVWATMLSVLVLGVSPQTTTLIGASLIVASGIYTAHRERVRARQALKKQQD